MTDVSEKHQAVIKAFERDKSLIAERRCQLIQIDQRTLFNFFTAAKTGKSGRVSLPVLPDLEDYIIGDIYGDFMTRCIYIQVFHPSFDSVVYNQTPPIMGKNMMMVHFQAIDLNTLPPATE